MFEKFSRSWGLVKAIGIEGDWNRLKYATNEPRPHLEKAGTKTE